MNNKVKKRKHLCRYDRCEHGWKGHKGFSLVPGKTEKVGSWKCTNHDYCKCGKVRPLNNKVEGVGNGA